MQATMKRFQAHDSKVIAMPNLFNETMNILIDAQHYFSNHAYADQQQLESMNRLVYSSEMSRITLRLSSVMAWLLARRAHHNGQLSAHELRKHYALQFADVCCVDSSFFKQALPEYVIYLHQESLKLYRRVMALDYVELQAHSA